MKPWACKASPQYSVNFGDNFVEIWYFTGQNVLFWSGSIKRPDLQTAYRYRAKSFRVDSNIIGRSAVTRSDLMRVSHSWTRKLNILEILTHFWPASEPVDRQPLGIWTLCFLCLPCPPIPSDAGNMKPWACKASPQYSVKFGDNSVEIWYFTGQNGLFWSGSIKRPDLQAAYRYRAKSFRVDSNMIGPSAVTRSDLMWVSHSWTPKLNIIEILTHFWPESEPCRQATINDMDFMFPVPALTSLT